MDDLIKVDDNLVEQNSDTTEVYYNNIFNIRPSSPDVDFKGAVNKVLQYVDVASVIHNIKKGVEYVVQIPAELQGGFESGKYWIMENSKTGTMWPTLMELGKDGKNKIVTPLAVKKKDFIQGNPVKDITNNYQNLYLQQQLQELSSLIQETLQVVERIENGQLDDRIALLDAGRDGIILALNQKDDASRPMALSNAMNNVGIAQKQIFKTFERRVAEFEPLPKAPLALFFKEVTSTRGYLAKKDREYDEIQQYYSLYLEATRMLAEAYMINGDIENAKRVFNMSVKQIENIDFSSLRTIEYAHKGADFAKIYDHAVDFIEAEKIECIESNSNYDCIEISVSGDELLEVIESEREISSKES